MRVAAVGLALLVAALGAGAWLLVQPAASLFVVPGAVEVRVEDLRVGERRISYRMARPEDGWQTLLAYRLLHSGWERKQLEPWGNTENFVPAYTRTATVWPLRLDEEVELTGSREYAVITVTRRMRFVW